LELDAFSQDYFRRHNPIYFPPQVIGVEFDYWINNADALFTNDRLEVRIGNEVIDTITLGSRTGGFVRDRRAYITPAAEGFVDTLEFRINDGGDAIQSGVRIDNVELMLAIAPWDPDRFEPNDSIVDAVVLGSEEKTTLRDLTIHDLIDVDYFRITASDTGKLIVNALFANDGGDLNLRIRDSHANIIASATSTNDDEQLVIPVVGQEEYFVEVFGVAGATNRYSLEIENFPTPIPDFLDLPAKDINRVLNDTGHSQADNVTSRTDPEIIIEADLDEFAREGITILTPQQAADGDVPGAAVQVFVNGNAVGFADLIPGTGNTLFRYTFPNGQLPVEVFPDDSEGWLHYVKAAVQIIDGQRDAAGEPAAASARTQLSQPLPLVVDTEAPPVSTPDLLETSDSGNSNTDNLTSVNPPAFRGTAEHNSRIRIFANGVLVGTGSVGTDLTDNGFDQVGAWEVTVEPLKYGQYTVWAEAQDLAGNITQSEPLTIVVDPYEPNNNHAQATILGSLPKVTLNDVLLHNQDDVDRFKYTAAETGRLIVNAFSEGAVALRVRDVHGNLVQTATPAVVTPGLNIDQLVIPVVSQEEYFIEVLYNGAPPAGPYVQHVAIYDLEIENFAAPIPDLVDLPAKNQSESLNDTGENVFDDVTVRTAPEIIVQVDLDAFHAAGITLLDPADPDFGTLAGAAVEIFVNGVSVGFATEIAGKGHTLFRYVFQPGQLPLDDPNQDFHADSRGWLHYVAAAVRIFDGRQDVAGMPDPAQGRTPLSDPLVLRVDEVAPFVSPPDLLASSDTGHFHNDNVTGIRTPAFQGTGEHNAIIRIYARDVTDPGNPGPRELVGQGRVGSDLTEGDFNQVGNWEVTVEPLDDGVYDITAETEDLAGNHGISAALRIEIDTRAPNTTFLDLVESSDSGRHNDDNITNDNAPDVTLTTHDPNVAAHQLLFDDYLRFRIWDRFEGAASQAEFLLYDSALEPAVENTSVANDTFTSLTLVAATLPLQYFNLSGANAAVLGPGVLADGIHNLKLEVEDRAGNISADFLLELLIDTQAFLGDVQLDPDSDTGIWGYPATMQDGITCDMTPTFFGKAEANNLVTLVIDGTPAGTAVAIPLDGDDALQPPNAPYEMVEGNWSIESQIALGNGVHTAVFTYEDPAGNRATTANDPLLFFIDCLGPRITNVTHGDVSTDGSFTLDENTTSVFQPKPDGGPDPLISSIVVHFRDLPPRTAAFNYPALFEALAEEEGNYRLVGDANGHIPILEARAVFQTPTNGVDPAIARVELIFHDPGPDGQLFTNDDRGAPLPDDRFTLTVFDTLADPAGNRLDGESGAAGPFAGNNAPNDTPPTFPTGDGEHGGDFLARFTVDSRPEIGTWSAGSAYLDTNGNFVFDPDNADFTNRDIVHTLGFATDHIFAGNFLQDPNGVADGFDKLAAYGRMGGGFRWLIDFTNDGVPDATFAEPAGFAGVGIPIAGDFDNNPANGDEIGLFTGRAWLLDTDHDFSLADQTPLSTAITGLPFVGDFDGDGVEDLGTLNTNRNAFSVDLGPVYGNVDATFSLNNGSPFIGPRDRPVAADMDGDGIDDIGLWVPDRSGATPRQTGEWFFIVSGGQSLIGPGGRIVPAGDPATVVTVDFTPTPFGNDIFAKFGEDFAIPIVGNFDPPTTGRAGNQSADTNESSSDVVTPSDEGDEQDTVSQAPTNDQVEDTNQQPAVPPATATTPRWQNPINACDVNHDGHVTALDALVVANHMNRLGGGTLSEASGIDNLGLFVDTNGDDRLTPFDVLLIVNYIEQSRATAGEGESAAWDAGQLQNGPTNRLVDGNSSMDVASLAPGSFAATMARQAKTWPSLGMPSRRVVVDDAYVAGVQAMLLPDLESVIDTLAADRDVR
jgi:hypothetical protein